MFVMDEAKLPPPTPARALTHSSVVNDTPGSRTIAIATVGTSSSSGRDHGPVPSSEHRDGERVRNPYQCAEQGRHRGQQELLADVEAVVRAEKQHQHRPQRPHREADVLARDRIDQVASGDAGTGLVPEVRILGAPVVDPVADAPGFKPGTARRPSWWYSSCSPSGGWLRRARGRRRDPPRPRDAG